MNKGLVLLILIAVFVLGGGIFYYLNYMDKGESPVIVDYPKAGSEIVSPMSFSGKARGTWFFEASFPVKVYDDADNFLGVGIARAKSDWMTTDFVEFSGEVNFTAPKNKNGKVVFEKDNPSGLPEHAGVFVVPIKFK